MAITLFPACSARLAAPVFAIALLAAGGFASVAHAQTEGTPTVVLTGAASVSGTLTGASGRTITLGPGGTANVQTTITNPTYNEVTNRTMLGYRAEYGGPESFFFERRTLTGGNRYDFFGAPAAGPYPATVTGGTTFRGSGTDQTYADTGSSTAGLTVTQQLGIAAPVAVSGFSAGPLSAQPYGPSVALNFPITFNLSRGTTYFSALDASLASPYNDLYQLEMEMYVNGVLQDSRSGSYGFNGGETGTHTRMLNIGGLVPQRDSDPVSAWPNLDFYGRVRWVGDAGASFILPGSEFHYGFAHVPAPGAGVLLGLGGVVAMRRRRK